MNRLAQLESALVKADAAGNADDARALAAAIRQERAAAGGANDSPLARMVRGVPQERSTAQDLARGAGLTARYALSGPLEFAGMFTDPIAERVGLGSARQGAQALGDALGLPNPETKGERIVAEGSKAATGGGLMAAGGRLLASSPGLIGRVGAVAAERPVLQAASNFTGASASANARESGAGQGEQALWGLLGGVAPGAARYGVGAGVRGALRGGEAGRQTVLRNVETFRRAGTAPSVGQATENGRTRAAESLLAGVPGGTGRMADAAQRQAGQIAAKVEASAAGLSPKSSATAAGGQIVKGVSGTGGFVDRFKAQAARLYDEVDRHFPPNSPVPVTATKQYLAQATAPIAGAPALSARLANKELAELNTALDADLQSQVAQAQAGTLPYEAIKTLRTRIGEKIADAGLDPDIPTKQLRRLYGALSQDVNAAVRASGNPRAAAALSRAESHYKAGMGRIDAISSVIDRNGGPERVFSAAMNGTREGATTLRAVMQSLKPDEQKMVTATFLRRLGRANPSNQSDLGDAFSTERFLTNWNSTSPEARRVMFGRMGPRFNADMDAIAKAAANLRDGSAVYRNPSGTANRTAQIAAGTSFAVALATGGFKTAGMIAAGAGTANVVAKGMTSPVFVNWLAKQTKVPASAFVQQVAQLKRIAVANGDADAAEIADQLAQQPAAN